MSFLNPVNEPVLLFSSTDADAPQINHNARTAGDIKAVLKACLVTGYGPKASAGWSIVNEVSHVAEFVSPSAAMSDYRLGIDDTLTTATTWYYQYQNARVNPNYNAPSKNFDYIDKSNSGNGWQLLVTNRGVYFLESVFSSVVNNFLTRLLYLGQVKSAIADLAGINIAYWQVGYGAQVATPYTMFTPNSGTYRHYRLASYTVLNFSAANIDVFIAQQKNYNISTIDIASQAYLMSGSEVVALHPGLLLKDVNNADELYGTSETTVDNRSAIKLCLGISNGSATTIKAHSRAVLIYLDYWEY